MCLAVRKKGSRCCASELRNIDGLRQGAAPLVLRAQSDEAPDVMAEESLRAGTVTWYAPAPPAQAASST